MMGRRGTSSGGGASSLGYLFGSDATTLARPNNRAPPRPQQPSENISSNNTNRDSNRDSNMYTGLSNSMHEEFEHDATGYATPTGYETPSGYQTPRGYRTPRTDSSDGNRYGGSPGAGAAGHSASAARNHLPQTRAAGKVTSDGGGVSLDMSGGSFMGGNNNYFRADGQNSGNFITGRPSTRVQAAPGGVSSLGYLFGGP